MCLKYCKVGGGGALTRPLHFMGQIFFEAGWCLPHECNLMYLAHDFINGWGGGGGVEGELLPQTLQCWCPACIH